ncbi:MAG: tetratricopeptide repeat protein [Pyrinomonadaceae bacterium]
MESTVNAIGYRFIRSGDLEKALEVLQLNTEYFPKAFNTWDSLAEVYMLKGNKDLAVRYYKKSLELNPGNTNAVNQIKKLESGQ